MKSKAYREGPGFIEREGLWQRPATCCLIIDRMPHTVGKLHGPISVSGIGNPKSGLPSSRVEFTAFTDHRPYSDRDLPLFHWIADVINFIGN